MAEIEVRFDGLAELRNAVQRAGPDMQRKVTQRLRGAVAPIVADARGRMSRLPGTGKRAAEGITGGVFSSDSVYLRLGQRDQGFVFPREFGGPKQIRTSVYQMHGGGWARGWSGTVTRRVNYALPSQFGPWTGNQFTVEGGAVAGHAFFPAARDGFQRLDEQMKQIVDDVLSHL